MIFGKKKIRACRIYSQNIIDIFDLRYSILEKSFWFGCKCVEQSTEAWTK